MTDTADNTVDNAVSLANTQLEAGATEAPFSDCGTNKEGQAERPLDAEDSQPQETERTHADIQPLNTIETMKTSEQTTSKTDQVAHDDSNPTEAAKEPTPTETAVDASVPQIADASIEEASKAQALPPLGLFASQGPSVAQVCNTSFATEPTTITYDNAGDLFRYDHTPIKFRGGHPLGDNYEYATAIPFDIDNSHSDNPDDWMSPEKMYEWLKELGLIYWMAASRNHWLTKDGKALRPKFHVYLPLARPLYNSSKFVLYCEWCIKTFSADAQVKSKAQKIFGFGDNPEAFICYSEGGRCIDEVLTDDDLADGDEKRNLAEPTVVPAFSGLPTYQPSAVVDFSNVPCYDGEKDYDELMRYLQAKEITIEIAKRLCGLSDGNRPNDPERHQACPICREGHDRFLYRPHDGSFYCRVCAFNGNAVNLVAKVHNVTPSKAFDIIAWYSEFCPTWKVDKEYTPAIPTIPKNSGKNGGNGNEGYKKNGTSMQRYNIRRSEYRYLNEQKRECYRIIRTDFNDEVGNPHKTFCVLHWESEGKLVKQEPETLYPYRLPEVLDGQVKRLYIVEGEKTADTLREILIAAGCVDTAVTTSQGGSGRGELWKKFLEHYPGIADRTICILPDNDEPGRKYARTVATAFLEANPAANIQIISLAGLPDGGDFVDWCAAQRGNNKTDMDILETLFGYCGHVDYSEMITPDVVASWSRSNPNAVMQKTWQPFPLETFPSQLRYFIDEISRSIGIDPANAAVCVLSILSGTIGRSFQIEVKRTYPELPMLWCAMIADSGFGKTPPLRFAQEPIHRLQSKAHKAYEEERKDYEKQMERYKRNQRKGAAAYDLIRPTEPVMQRYYASDCTTEALVPVLDQNPYGLCLIRDEIAAFFNGLDAYRSGKCVDRQKYIEMHNGLSVSVDRKKDGYAVADTPSLSIIGGIQTDIIRQTIKSEPDFLTTGFGARFLMAYPPAEPILWNSNEPDVDAVSSYAALIDRILSYRLKFRPDEPGIITLTPEAKELIFDFQNRHASESLNVSDGGVRTVMNKAGMHAARLCLNLHIIEHAEKDMDPLTPVSPETMQRALSLTEWFLNEAYRIYAMLRQKEQVDSEADIIYAKIKQHGGESTVRKLKDSIALSLYPTSI